jgi:serine phosphatase RsbU (regulator of sigma subunit)
MARPGVPRSEEIEHRRRDTEIVIAVFRTIFLLVVLFSPQFMEARGTSGLLLHAAIIAATVYNLALFVVHTRQLPFPRSVIVAVDVILISLWIYFSGPGAVGFFPLYFAVVIISAFWFGVSGAFLTALFASALYVWAVATARFPGGGGLGTTVMLQIVFLIVTAGVVSIAAEAHGRERQALASSRAVLHQFRERIRVAQYVDELVRPKRLPAAPGLEIGFQYRPAAFAFSGDYYDLIPLGGRRWGLCIADLSGQFSQQIGYLSTFKTTLRLTARREQSPARVLTEINREVAAAAADNVELEIFISMSYLVVDLDTGTLTYANAGHEPPVLIPAGAEAPVALACAGLVLGVLPEVVYQEESIPLHPGDTLVMFTDGMTEVMDRRGRLLGREPFLTQVLRHRAATTAQEMTVRIFEAVNDYGRGGRHRDDMTLLIARVVAADLGQPAQ